VAWYNDQHRHSGIGYLTPHSVHYGLAAQRRVIRQAALDAAFLANLQPLQEPQAAAASDANRCLDQPTN
jgi:hypothetical protein